MTDNRNNPNWEDHKNQDKEQNSGEYGTKQPAGSAGAPDDRLKDGTNDLANGDENPASARQSESSDTNNSQK